MNGSPGGVRCVVGGWSAAASDRLVDVPGSRVPGRVGGDLLPDPIRPGVDLDGSRDAGDRTARARRADRRPGPQDHPVAVPGIWAVEALATSIPLFLLLFAGTYLVLSTASAGNFNEHLTHSRALYFTVTVFSTEGFGDLKAESDAARLVITGQMIADLVIVGVALKVILGAAKRGQQRRIDSGEGRT